MPASRPRLRATAVGASVFVLIAVAAGSTFAASNPATLYACYNTTGAVAMSDTNQCKLAGGGRLVYWSTAGIPGPTGDTGATGPTGSTGPTGAPGAGSGTVYAHIAFGTTTTFLATPWFSAGIECRDSTTRDLTLSVPANGPSDVVANVIEFEGGSIPGKVYVGSSALGVPQGGSSQPILDSRTDAIVAEPAESSEARYIIAAWLYNDATGCLVTFTS